MTHLDIRDEEVQSWPTGSSIVVKFPYDEDESDLNACAAMITVTPELKNVVEQAAKTLQDNNNLRTVQIYWPLDVITNEIYGAPIPKNFSSAIIEIIESDFEQAIADEATINEIRRMSHLDAVTWISVERPFFGIGGCIVKIGCTIMKCIDFSIAVRAITASTNAPEHEPEADHAKRITRAIDDLCDLDLQKRNEPL